MVGRNRRRGKREETGQWWVCVWRDRWRLSFDGEQEGGGVAGGETKRVERD